MKARGHFGDLGVGGRITLMTTLKETRCDRSDRIKLAYGR
jgi:hypothetical protein